MSAEAKQQYQASLNRVLDAIKLKEPDMVPLIPVVEAFPYYYAGVTIQESMYDYQKAAAALDKFYADFHPDLGWDPVLMYPGKVMELLDMKWFQWPGRGIDDPNSMYQYIEREYMTEDEYDELLQDPTHFIQSKWLPRSFGALDGLKYLALRDSIWFGFFNTFPVFGRKEVQDSLQTLFKFAEEMNKWYAFLGEYDQKMENEFGIPLAYGAWGYAPFDWLGDTLRGTVPILKDIRERPEKLLAAVEMFTPIAIEASINGAKASGRPFVWVWLHKGVDQLMSKEQFGKFYWPSLRHYIEKLVDAGLTPFIYVEGSYRKRLDFLREVPRGKVVYDFEDIDMFEAKKALGDVACIAGNVPNALLSYGTPKEVEEYCKKLIDVCAPGGGFMMDTAAMVDDAKPENMQAMFRVTREHGVYRK
ncbi:methylcobalamin:coenzyme M methyltransferase [Peptococcaceae bacterium CEB3]|nr:methylcobalamin:coenzyme M methyltransferase [Peptococcaceae bacterium CEB3]